MKKFYLKKMLMAVVTLLCSVTASAHDFEVGGIYYNITSETDLTVEIIEGDYKYRTKINIPENVTSYDGTLYSVVSIGNNAFSGCRNLTSVTMGNSITSIGEYAFNGCSALTSIEIPNSVTSIEEYAFIGCYDLQNVYLLGEIPVAINDDTFRNYDATLYVPQGSLEAYKAADVWGDFKNIVEFDATAIEDIEDDAPALKVTAGGIQFTDAEGKAVAVYTAAGALVEKIAAYAGEVIALDNGIYIVRVGNKAVKVKL